MLGPNNKYFYWGTTRKIIASFGSLFTDISVTKQDQTGISYVKVPIAYGPTKKWLTRIREESDLDNRLSEVAIRLPRMSFEITGLAVDDSSKIPNTQTYPVQNTPCTGQTIMRPGIPFRLSIQLNIMAKNQSDALQIMEQILPHFNPDYTIAVKDLEGTTQLTDIPIILTSVTLQDDYEGDAETRRTIIYTLDFDLKMKFYGMPLTGWPPCNPNGGGGGNGEDPFGNINGLIRTTNISFFDGSKYTSTVSTGVLDPSQQPPVYTITVDENAFIAPATPYTLTLDSQEGTFVLAERAYSTLTGTIGVVSNLSPLTVIAEDGLFVPDEFLIGMTSKAYGKITEVQR